MSFRKNNDKLNNRTSTGSSSRRPGRSGDYSAADEATRQAISERERACNESLDNTLRTLADTDKISQRTANKLENQTEQLQRINEQTENINHNLDHSQYLLQGMKSWMGRARGALWGSPQKEEKAPETPPKKKEVPKDNRYIRESREKHDMPQHMTASRGSNSHGSQVKTANRQVTEALSEEDRKMDQILGFLDDIKERSVNIGQTIDTQNNLIHGISASVQTANEKMNNAQRDIKSLM